MALPKRKKKGQGADPAPFPVVPLSELTHLNLFREIPRHALLLLEGKVRKAVAEANETLLELSHQEELFQYFFFILKGQMKVVGYDEAARTRPLNFLRKGEFFLDKTVTWGDQVATKVVAITAVELLIIPRDQLKLLAEQFAPFRTRLRTMTERIDYRNRIYSEDKYARSVLDFLVDTGLTQASRVKITQLDKCIECNTCYTSCEERHGFQRLERGYARFGVLDFAKSCLTCFYPTCIPACPVDSVVFNAQKGEVEILDDCIGCSACARACQYGAIRMFKVDPEESLYARFLAPDKKIKPKFVADKCNHCYGFEDMACISNCPTGAIIEVEATDLLENPRIFGADETGWKALPSFTERSSVERFLQKTYFTLGFLLTGWLILEAIALTRFPGVSILLQIQKLGFLSPAVSLKFGPGTDFCWFLGNAGFSLIMIGLLYPLRKAFPRPFKYLGKKPLWLDFHNFCGAMGTILVLFHTGFSFSLTPSTLGFVALVGVAVSGAYGRFLYTMIPRGVAGTELKMEEIAEEDAAVSKKLDALFAGSTTHRAIIQQLLSILTPDPASHPTLFQMFRSVLKSRYLIFKLRFRVPTELRINRRQIRIFLMLLREKIRLQRNVAFLALSKQLMRQWQFVHRPLAYVMSTIIIGHIVYNVFFFAGR